MVGRPLRPARSPVLIDSADTLGMWVRLRRTKLKMTQARIAGVTGLDPANVSEVERGRNESVPLRVVLLVVNALGMDVELRPRDLPFVPVPPTHVDELGLSPRTLAALRAIGIREVDQLPSPTDLLARPEFESGHELYELVSALTRHGLSMRRSKVLADERELEILRLRVVEGLTLKEIGDRYGFISERTRQILAAYFGLHGTPPAAKRGRKRRGHAT